MILKLSGRRPYPLSVAVQLWAIAEIKHQNTNPRAIAVKREEQ